LLDLPIGRGEETDAVREARKKEQAGAFGHAHQLMRQIERAPDLLPACPWLRRPLSGDRLSLEFSAISVVCPARRDIKPGVSHGKTCSSIGQQKTASEL
jgi:hypothetical protein